ncbi:T9SS type A sorting domain-containing protein [Weeksellaceae bacterium TAE3-ERU29]|nr:T9SS type A sorting domain-containing protein [Weeksellaceae bacterium TAE3-ERU29]
MLRRCILLIAFLSAMVGVMGQQNSEQLYDPYTPEYFIGDEPAWLQDIVKNPRGVNFFEMEKKFAEWIKNDIDARKKTVDKKPAVNFYRRWQKAYRPFVNNKGEIVLPTMKEYLQKIDRVNQKINTQFSKRKILSKDTKKWVSVGPHSTSKNDQYTGFVESYDSHANVFRIDISKTNPNILYCGAETGAVFKTTDKGKSWKACAPSVNFGTAILAIRIDPTNENIVWIGSDIGVFVSKDGGESFTRISGIDSKINSIRINKKNTDIITVSAEKGFYISENKGKYFRKIFDGVCHDHELKPDNSDVVYLLGNKTGDYTFKFYTSYDGGKTFDEGNAFLKDIRMGRLAVSDAPKGENYVYALVNIFKPGVHYGAPQILQSKDAGKTWTNKTVRTDNINGYNNTFCPSIDAKNGGQGYYDMMIGVSGTNPEHVIFGLCSAYRSLKGGEGGYKENAIGGYCSGNFRIHPDMQDIAIYKDEVWIANDGGIKYSPNFFKNENGEITGENRVKGIYAADYWGFGQGWNEDVMAGGRWHNGDAVMIKNYGKGKAVYVGGVEQATGYVMVSNPYKVYFSDAGMYTMPETIDGKITADHNVAFNQKRPYEVLKSYGFLATDPRYAKRILLHPSGRFYGSLDQIWETKDEGINFNLVYDTPREKVSNIAFARSNPDVIYACGRFFIFKSTDNGKNWEKLEIPNPAGNSSYIAVDPKDENKVWLVQSLKEGGVLYSEDGGKSWKEVLDNNLKDIQFRWVVLAGDEYNGVYLGTENEAKVYYKDDTMSKWIDYSEGLPPAAGLTRLVPFFKEGKLRAATRQGIWEIPLYREKFKPVAQPLAINIAETTLHNANEMIQFESYSIVNQEDVKWEWSFSPEPYSVSDKNIRNPKVVFKYNDEYDVTLKVTTPGGTDTRTIKKMIIVTNGEKRSDTPKPVEPTPEFKISPTTLKVGEIINVEVKGIKGEKTLKLYDSKNKLIKEINIEEEVTKISTEGFSAGVYRYEFKSDKLNKTGEIKIEKKDDEVTPIEPTPEFKISPTTLKSGEIINVEVKGIKDEKTLKLYNSKNELVKEINIEKEVTEISTEGFSAGVYRYEFKSEKLNESGQITIEKKIEKSENNFEVYPTLLKSGENLNLKIKGYSGNKQFTIYDAKGALIKEVKIDTDKEIEQVSTHGLIRGVYIYQFSTPTFMNYGKFIIQ